MYFLPRLALALVLSIPLFVFASAQPVDQPLSNDCSSKGDSWLQCMVCNCYFETDRGQTDEFADMVAINRVVLTRADHRHTDPCTEIYRRSQFSWTLYSDDRKQMVRDGQFKKCIIASNEAYSRGASGFDHYHDYRVTPNGWSCVDTGTQVGHDVFCSL
jgi:hypothetical protein